MASSNAILLISFKKLSLYRLSRYKTHPILTYEEEAIQLHTDWLRWNFITKIFDAIPLSAHLYSIVFLITTNIIFNQICLPILFSIQYVGFHHYIIYQNSNFAVRFSNARLTTAEKRQNSVHQYTGPVCTCDYMCTCSETEPSPAAERRFFLFLRIGYFFYTNIYTNMSAIIF